MFHLPYFRTRCLGCDSLYLMFSTMFQMENFPCVVFSTNQTNVSPMCPPKWEWCRIFHISLHQSSVALTDVARKVCHSSGLSRHWTQDIFRIFEVISSQQILSKLSQHLHNSSILCHIPQPHLTELVTNSIHQISCTNGQYSKIHYIVPYGLSSSGGNSRAWHLLLS